MKPVIIEKVQAELDRFANEQVYLHLETTNGAYANHRDEKVFTSGAYIRNGLIQYTSGKITGTGPYRVGLKLPLGWVYAEGITHFEMEKERILLAGYDFEGKLAVALQLSKTPFA